MLSFYYRSVEKRSHSIHTYAETGQYSSSTIALRSVTSSAWKHRTSQCQSYNSQYWINTLLANTANSHSVRPIRHDGNICTETFNTEDSQWLVFDFHKLENTFDITAFSFENITSALLCNIYSNYEYYMRVTRCY